MPRQTNDYPHVINFRTNDETKTVVAQFADENDVGKSEAIRRLINYGILYYYYEKSRND